MNDIRPRAGDGAFATPLAEVDLAPRDGMGWGQFTVWTMPGAEQRPISPLPVAAPSRRVAWPSYLALAAIVLALDHGIVGAAALVAIWWLGWAVAR